MNHESTLQRLDDYRGDTFLVDSYMADGLSREAAVAEVESPFSMEFFIGTPYVHKDRYLAAALGRALLHRDPLIVKAQADRNRPLNRPGTKANPETGKFKYEQVADLTAAGKTDSQIAKEVFGNPNKSSSVTAIRDRDQKRLENLYSARRPSNKRLD